MTQKPPKRIEFGRHYRDKGGRVGAPIHLNLGDGGWNGHYKFLSHGKSDEEVLAEIHRITLHHQAKAARLTAFASLKRTLTVSGIDFQIVDLTLDERGTDVELRMSIENAAGERIQVIKNAFRTVADIPEDGALVQMAIVAAQGWFEDKAAIAAKQTELATLVAPLIGGVL